MLFKIGSLLAISVPFVILYAAWRFADWRNWRHYYPTILFVMFVDVFSSILTYSHTLWLFTPVYFLRNHTLQDFYLVLLAFPPAILLYLSRFPSHSSRLKQFVYCAAWVASLSLFEASMFLTHQITYHNGWSYGWSVFLWFVLFPIARLHHTHPLWAWVSIGVCTIFVLVHFQIPITRFK